MSSPSKTVPAVPPRQNILYPIPTSTISLDIILNESKPLVPSAVTATLEGAMAEARKHPRSDLVEGVFRYPPAAAAALDDTEKGREREGHTGGGEEAEFGIVGGLYSQELTWGDAVVVLQGLRRFCEGEQGGCWVAVIFYMQDGERGVLGDGFLQPRTGVREGGRE